MRTIPDYFKILLSYILLNPILKPVANKLPNWFTFNAGNSKSLIMQKVFFRWGKLRLMKLAFPTFLFNTNFYNLPKTIFYFLLIIGISLALTYDRKQPKPNIIFILTDDHRWDALGYSGNPVIKTPNMDDLARNGLYFKNAFASTPICAASRASLLTGLYERTHNYTFGRPNLKNEYLLKSYPYLLRKAGYRTGFVGKFGVKVNEGMVDTLFDWHKLTYLPYWKELNGTRKHLVDINGDHAVDFIKSSQGQPFCLSLSFWSPHAEDDKKEQYFWPENVDSLYIHDKIPLPITGDSGFFNALPDFLKTTMNRQRWYWRFDTPEKYQQMVKGYYRMISGVDLVIGRLRNSLKELGLEKNTVIIIAGDNGYFLGERGYADKWLMHETSIRTPMILFDPRMTRAKQKRTVTEMVLNLDITATILDLANAEIPKDYHGTSLMAFYKQKPSPWRKSVFLEHRLEGNPLLLKTDAYRDDTWKFIRYDDHPDFFELYNHKEDPYEITNLASNIFYANQIKHYKSMCDSIVGKLMEVRVN